MLAESLPGTNVLDDALRISACTIVGVFVFFIANRSLGGRELGVLLRGGVKKRKK
jgi:hypothetical protein